LKRESDADLLLELLLLHRDKLRRLSPDDEATRRVQNLVEERRNLVDEKTAQSNRLTGYLKLYFPQMLEWFEKLDMPLVCDSLERWPTLEELQKVPPELYESEVALISERMEQCGKKVEKSTGQRRHCKRRDVATTLGSIRAYNNSSFRRMVR
jgi:transposase